MQSEVFIKILLTIIFGAILGLETETREIEKIGHKKADAEEKGRIGGVRTYTVISLFGGIAGLFYNAHEYLLVYILFSAIILLILAAYILNVQVKRAFGMTTEIAIIITFILGFLTTSELVPVITVLIILVLLTFFLSQKRGIGQLIHKIGHQEVIDVIKFGLVAIVILPLLPNKDFYLSDLTNALNLQNVNLEQFKNFVILNPFQTWFIVVLITGISLAGYFLSRIFGKGRGILLTAMVSGIISSTSATISFATKDKKNPGNHYWLYAGAVLISTAFSYTILALFIFIGSRDLFLKIYPFLLIMFTTGFVVGLIYLAKQKLIHSKGDFEVKYEPFSIGPAIKFVSFIVAIKLLIQFLQILHINNNLLIAITALSGVVGMDAQTIAFSGLVSSGVITITIGILAFLLTNIINYLAKISYAYLLGTRKFLYLLILGLIIMALSSLVGFLFL